VSDHAWDHGGLLERGVLLSPNLVAHAAMNLVHDPAQRWMLNQPLRVRRSYVHEVFDRGNGEREQTIWMLRQPDEVRRSYVAAVGGPPEMRWMLNQPASVRESYITEVLR
jgi:hypothetical protein